MNISEVNAKSKAIIRNMEKVIIGKNKEIELILSALIAQGHVLLEDVPGTGKTMLAKTLAKSFDCDFGRIQFTPDLLPSDLTGINYYSPKSGDFIFRKGGLFTNILLADEINRATPRTQAGLLESMEERQATIDGTTYPLGKPYFVIATQNPVETHGTFPLPEAQLDRFIVQLSIGYPRIDEEISIIKRFVNDEPLQSINSVCTRDELIEMQNAVKDVFIHDEICQYMASIAAKTRDSDQIALGVSTRGNIMLARLAKSYAMLNGRDFVTPDDIKYLIPFVFAHRIVLKSGVKGRRERIKELLDDIINAVPAPTEDWKIKGEK